MKHTFETKVYYFDTDSYRIVWHGAYLKWFEMGRVDYFSLLAEDLDNLKSQNLQFPIVNVSVRYKSPAKFGDTLVVETVIDRVTNFSIRFQHDITDKQTGRLIVTGMTEVVVTDLGGKLVRRMPEFLLSKFKKVENLS